MVCSDITTEWRKQRDIKNKKKPATRFRFSVILLSPYWPHTLRTFTEIGSKDSGGADTLSKMIFSPHAYRAAHRPPFLGLVMVKGHGKNVVQNTAVQPKF